MKKIIMVAAVLFGSLSAVYAETAAEQLAASAGSDTGAAPAAPSVTAAGISAALKEPAAKPTGAGQYKGIRKPMDPAPSPYYAGKLLCNTRWVMFVTGDQEETGTLIINNFSSYPANQVLMLGSGSSMFTLQQGQETASFQVVLDPLMTDNSQTGLYYCRLKMPKPPAKG
mgnify:CR=1 FL=1